jgi:hypothetical protein
MDVHCYTAENFSRGYAGGLEKLTRFLSGDAQTCQDVGGVLIWNELGHYQDVLARDAPHQSNGVRISDVPHALPSGCARLFDVVKLAEGVGFEPTKAFALPVFKTGAINRSTTPPDFRSREVCHRWEVEQARL